MATGALGGVPSVTSTTFSFTGQLTNYVIYTCPANTICYANFKSFSSTGSTTMNEFGLTFHNGFAQEYRSLLAGGVFSNAGPLMGSPAGSFFKYDSTGTLYNSGLAARMDSPIAVSTGSGITSVIGQLIIYPGESIYISTAPSGFGTHYFSYNTIEVTAGS